MCVILLRMSKDRTIYSTTIDIILTQDLNAITFYGNKKEVMILIDYKLNILSTANVFFFVKGPEIGVG